MPSGWVVLPRLLHSCQPLCLLWLVPTHIPYPSFMPLYSHGPQAFCYLHIFLLLFIWRMNLPSTIPSPTCPLSWDCLSYALPRLPHTTCLCPAPATYSFCRSFVPCHPLPSPLPHDSPHCLPPHLPTDCAVPPTPYPMPATIPVGWIPILPGGMGYCCQLVLPAYLPIPHAPSSTTTHIMPTILTPTTTPSPLYSLLS